MKINKEQLKGLTERLNKAVKNDCDIEVEAIIEPTGHEDGWETHDFKGIKICVYDGN